MPFERTMTLGLFVRACGLAFGRFGGFRSRTLHDETALVLACGLEVENAFGEHELAGCVPEVEREDLALAREEVVLDAEALHGLEMAAQDGRSR